MHKRRLHHKIESDHPSYLVMYILYFKIITFSIVLINTQIHSNQIVSIKVVNLMEQSEILTRDFNNRSSVTLPTFNSLKSYHVIFRRRFDDLMIPRTLLHGLLLRFDYY